MPEIPQQTCLKHGVFLVRVQGREYCIKCREETKQKNMRYLDKKPLKLDEHHVHNVRKSSKKFGFAKELKID